VIGRLTGKVAAQEADGSIVLEVGGVGYELAAPLGTLGRVRADEGGRVTLWVHTHVREDALSLFGFSDETERAAFRALVSVSNVGPKIAIAVLGALPSLDLARVIASRDLAALTRISGIGKKIAERLLLELRDKIPAGPTALSVAGVAAPPPKAPALGDDRLRSALTGMGFRPAEADRAVSSMGERAQSSSVPFEDLMREALALLAK
jgi:Holliday junction DNA helicase RuvA